MLFMFRLNELSHMKVYLIFKVDNLFSLAVTVNLTKQTNGTNMIYDKLGIRSQ